jgi:hypothetical protein
MMTQSMAYALLLMHIDSQILMIETTMATVCKEASSQDAV